MIYQDLINYAALIDEAMHIIVKKALLAVKNDRLPGQHHFFISFLTNYPGVSLSERVKKNYPHEMTIVLQYQFEELTVNDKDFSVILSFDNVKEKIIIPFAALTAFADPSVKFGLQFKYVLDSTDAEGFESNDMSDLEDGEEAEDDVGQQVTYTDNVIKFNNFKKKKD